MMEAEESRGKDDCWRRAKPWGGRLRATPGSSNKIYFEEKTQDTDNAKTTKPQKPEERNAAADASTVSMDATGASAERLRNEGEEFARESNEQKLSAWNTNVGRQHRERASTLKNRVLDAFAP